MISFSNNEIEIVIRIFVAAVLGISIGMQREKRKLLDKNYGSAGLRTHAMVCLGSALITSAGSVLFPSDPIRLAASIMTGIGFIGAGTIIASGGRIKGLTNAASIWISAAIGIATGLGLYISAICATIVTLLVLELKRFEKVD
ncbi:MAG: MgtC/SapB family protein [Nanoarchaeota archaeon]|nr:MgtC/SapB family protein [Nanoarchaeota archaeon]